MIGKIQFSDAEMHSAFRNRDPYYDHLFYQGVVTTGIYCRTVCPAKLPYPKNVKFFNDTSKAEAHGFRPCKRCKPDQASSFKSVLIRGDRYSNHPHVFEFLSQRAVTGLELVTPSSYTRAVSNGGVPALLSVHLGSRSQDLFVRYWGDIAEIRVKEWVSQTFDLEAPVASITRQLKRDLVLGTIVAESPFLPLPTYTNLFEGMVRAVIGQLISVKAARTILGRFVQTYGSPLPRGFGSITHQFPTIQAIAELATASLAQLGLTSKKSAATISIANYLLKLEAAPQSLVDRTPERICSDLRRIPGIGPWTVEMIRMETLHDTDAFPHDDLGVRRALTPLIGSMVLTTRTLRELQERWRPWSSYAVLHLWKNQPAKMDNPSSRIGA